MQKPAAVIEAEGKSHRTKAELNTYCLLYAEIAKLESDRERIQAMMDKLMNQAEEICDSDELIQAVKAIDKMLGKILSVGATIDQKRRLMLAIDKENVMTVSAASALCQVSICA